MTPGEQSFNLTGRIADLLYLLGRERPDFSTVEAATTALKDTLASGHYLLVIDDVWRASDLKPFIRGASQCARLITTRIDSVLPPEAQRIIVDATSRNEATTLLQTGIEGTDMLQYIFQDFASHLFTAHGKWKRNCGEKAW